MSSETGNKSELVGAQTRIVLTNGSKTVDLVWTKHTGTDVYLFHGSLGDHRSYHRSGQVHSVYGGVRDHKHTGVPLAELTGAFSLMTIGFRGNDISTWVEGIKHGGNEPSNVAAIDTRTLPAGEWVHVDIGLVEPHRMDLLGRMIVTKESIGVETRQLVCVTNVMPWVYLAITVGFPPDDSPIWQ